MNYPNEQIENNADAQQINECLDLVTKILGDNLLGVYLYGSALVGGLQKYSDIDLFVVTNHATTLSEKLETNTICSKPDAADWVIERLPKTYQAVMNRAKSICIGDENEYWEEIKASLKPCADWMLQEINKIKLSINPNKIAYKVSE